jgi:hypothetical protein
VNNFKISNDHIEVWKSFQVDDGSYYALLVVNWDDKKTQSMEINLVDAGVAFSEYNNCAITNLWNNELIGVF